MLPVAVLGARALVGASRTQPNALKAALGKGATSSASQTAHGASASGRKMLHKAAQSAARWAQDQALEHVTGHVQSTLEKYVPPAMAARLATESVTEGHSLLTMMAGLALTPRNERSLLLARGNNALQQLLSLQNKPLTDNCEQLAQTAISMSQRYLPTALSKIEQSIDVFSNQGKPSDQFLNCILDRFIDSVGDKVALIVAQRHENINSSSSMHYTQADVKEGQRMLESPSLLKDFLKDNLSWQTYMNKSNDENPMENDGNNITISPSGSTVNAKDNRRTERNATSDFLKNQKNGRLQQLFSGIKAAELNQRDTSTVNETPTLESNEKEASSNVANMLKSKVNETEVSAVIDRAMSVIDELRASNENAIGY